MNTPALMGLSLAVWVSLTFVGRGDALPVAARDTQFPPILGLTGRVRDVKMAVPASSEITSLSAAEIPADIDLKRMAEWALHYLTETPRKNLGYEPVFQCHPLQCPPVPEGQDPVVACDTDARMDWEWYYMRDITGSKRGMEVEAAFHNRIRQYIDPEGKVWSHPGCFNEGNTTAKYDKKHFVIHIWGARRNCGSASSGLETPSSTLRPRRKARLCSPEPRVFCLFLRNEH